MARTYPISGFSAARLVASTFGVLAGIGGITHGIGEVLQGNVASAGLMFDSWTEGPIAVEMDGDPAFSIIPNLLVTGVLALLISGAVVVWSVFFVQRRHGGAVLILLSVAMLLVGGGVGPPLIGMLAGVAGTAIHAPLRWWRTHLSPAWRRRLAALWPWAFGVTLLNGLFLFGGAIVLASLVSLGNSALFLNSFFFAVVSLLVTLLTAIGYDLEQRAQSGRAPVGAAPG